MKKSLVAIFIVLALAVSLIGCYSGVNIDFSADYSPIGVYYNIGLEFGKLIDSRKSLKQFYESDVFKYVNKEIEMAKYDESFFENKSLLIVMFASNNNCNKEIKSITKRGNALWVTIKTNNMNSYNEVARFFIELDRGDVEGITEINYKILSIF